MTPTAPIPSGPECLREMRRRILTLWWVKMPGTIIGIAVFFAAYFWVLRNPFFPVTIVPVTALDRWLEFRPEALGVYVSLWLYVGLLPALLKNGSELSAYVWQALALSVAGLVIFMLWPSAVPVREIDWTQHPGFELLKGIDATGNACPSLHVAFAVFSAIGLARVLREMGASKAWRAGNWAWCAGIGYSTLAIAQHVVLDVVAGAALGALVALAWPRGRRA